MRACTSISYMYEQWACKMVQNKPHNDSPKLWTLNSTITTKQECGAHFIDLHQDISLMCSLTLSLAAASLCLGKQVWAMLCFLCMHNAYSILISTNTLHCMNYRKKGWISTVWIADKNFFLAFFFCWLYLLLTNFQVLLRCFKFVDFHPLNHHQ